MSPFYPVPLNMMLAEFLYLTVLPKKTLSVIILMQKIQLNSYKKRVIGTLRKDVFNLRLIFCSKHAGDLMNEYLPYYNKCRSHLTLKRDSQEGCDIYYKPSEKSRLKSVSVCGGLVYHYAWESMI